jgi:glycosyltransferase involved in cell wall biosynthesis
MIEKITIICESFNESRFLPHKKISKKIIFIKVNDIKNNFLVIFPIFFRIIACFFTSGHIIIAPLLLSPLIIFYLPLKWIKKENISLDTSYAKWKEDKYPIELGLLKPVLKFLWFSFLKDLKIRAINKPAYDFLKKYTNKIALIPHAVDTKIFYHDLRIKKNKKFTVLFVGKIEYKKGIDLILNTARKLPKIDFWLVGTGNYLKTVRKENLLNIKTFEWVEGAKKLNIIYNKCHCLILPSRKFKNWEELFGIVIIEAMATGIPVIASNCIGPKEIIENGKDGILFKKEDFNGLINSIMLLKNNEKLRKKLVKNANKKIVGKYIIEIVSKKLLSLIRTK